MAGQRIEILELRTLITLKSKGFSNRKVAAPLNINRKTVDSYCARFSGLELDFVELLKLEDGELRELFTEDGQTEKQRYEQLAGMFSTFEKELKRPGATLQVIWRRYLERYPEGYRYTQFTTHYRKWRAKVNASGKHIHQAGQKLFIDFCGKKLSYVDRKTGEYISVEIFIAVLPCSQYTFVKGVHSQKREDFINALESCLSWMGGVPQAIVSDNLKSAVIKASRYAPQINKSLADFALFHHCVIDPARPYRPQDKAIVERSVKLVYQRIYFQLSSRTFFSLADLNIAIAEEMTRYNDHLFSHGNGSRRSLFLDVEKEYLQPLPEGSYSLRHYKRANVQKMSHIYLSDDRNYYSVPHRYVGHQVEVQYNQETVEILYNHTRIAKHVRSFRPGNYSTVAEHMPSNHQAYGQWSPEHFREWARKFGPSTVEYIDRLMGQYSYPEIAYKQSQGILSLGRTYGGERLEAACSRALGHTRSSYTTIGNILKNGLDRVRERSAYEYRILDHPNIRGPEHYR